MSLLSKLGLEHKKKKTVDLTLLNRKERRNYQKNTGVKIKGSSTPVVRLKK